MVGAGDGSDRNITARLKKRLDKGGFEETSNASATPNGQVISRLAAGVYIERQALLIPVTLKN